MDSSDFWIEFEVQSFSQVMADPLMLRVCLK